MSRAINRWTVPADGEWHALLLSGPIIHVAARNAEFVEVWALNEDQSATNHKLRAFATGESLPDGATHIGSTITAGGRLVWHLFEAVS